MNTLKKYKFFILLFLVVLSLFIPSIVNNSSFYWRDIFIAYYPLTDFIVNSIKDGVFPLWNPYLYTGMPQFASLEPSILYPANLIFFFTDYSTGLLLILILHYFIAAYGTFLFCRHIGLSNFSSCIGGISFGLSGYMISMYNVYPILFVISWLPYNLILIDRIINPDQKKSKKRPVFYLVLLNTIELLTGRFDIIYITFIFFMTFIIFRLLQHKSKLNSKIITDSAIYIFISFFIPVLISAVQIIPAMELLNNSVREAGVAYNQAQMWALHPLQICQMFIVGIWGDFFSGQGLYPLFGESSFGNGLFVVNIYQGIVCMIFAIYALCNMKNSRHLIYWLIVFLGFGLLALGKYLPLFELLYKAVPGFNLIRYSVKFFIISIFALSVMTAYGMEFFINRRRDKLMVWLTSIMALLTGIIYILIPTFTSNIHSIIKTCTGQNLGMNFLSQILSNIRMNFLQTLIILIAASLVIYLYSYYSQKRIFLFILGAIMFIDLFIMDTGQLWGIKKDFYNNDARLGSYLEDKIKNKPDYRIINSGTPVIPFKFIEKYMNSVLLGKSVYLKNVLDGNTSMLYSLHNAYGYHPMRPKNIDRLYSIYSMVKDEKLKNIIENISGSAYIIHHNEQKPKNTVLDLPEYGIKIEENKNNRRVNFRTDAILVNNENMMLQGIIDYKTSNFNPAKNTIIMENADYKKALQQVKKHKAKQIKTAGPFIYQKNCNQFSIYVYTNNSGYLVISDLFYHGWEASEDNIGIPLLRANYFAKAVRIGAGLHKIDFTYKPYSVRNGMIISLIGLLAGILLLFIKTNKIQKESDLQNE